MAETTLELTIPVLLPGVETDDDACLKRLESALQKRKGVQRAHLERHKHPVTLCLHYDPNEISLAEVQRLAERAGAQIVNRYHHAVLPIEGMQSSDSISVIEQSLQRIDGVLAVTVNYAAQRMRVEFDSEKTNLEAIRRKIHDLGYSIPAEGMQKWYQANRELIFSVVCGVLVLVGWAGGQFLHFPAAVSIAFYLAAYGFGGWDVSRHALHALREWHFDTDLLMVMAAIGAALLGDFGDGAFLLFLFSLGHALEERALDRARSAISALADLTPKTALVRRNGQETELPTDQIQIDDVVIVRPGVRVPVDGEILKGQSGIDQSPITGESVPVDKAPGDKVYAGSINGEGALEVKVTRLAKDNTLSRVMKMVEEAQTQRSPTQQLMERFEGIFVPIVLVGTVLVIVVPPLFGIPFQTSFLRAMTLLVAASPCALALGTPAAILTGIGRAASNGVLIKGGVHLENLGKLKAIAFDKTGTVTHGKPEVTQVLLLDTTYTEDTLLALVAALESRSGHPLAQSIVRAAQAKNLSVPSVAEVESLTGKGLKSVLDGQPVLVGNLKLMDEQHIEVNPDTRKYVEALQAEGKTIMVVAVGSRVPGLIALADTLRDDATAAMKALKATGVEHTIMLTGDNSRVAATIAKQVGLTDFRADLMPADKLTVIKELAQKYGEVAMVGDGVNDAPALANATVGIAMGGAGTDVALETADVALMSDDLSKLPFAVGLGRATRAVILQNLVFALGVIAVLITTSLFGIVGIGIAVSVHEGSTIVVALNALRLLGYRAASR